MVVLFAVLKIVATAVCDGVRKRGRHFGLQFVHRSHDGCRGGRRRARIVPRLYRRPWRYALVGMGTAFAGIVRTPLTSVIMIFEITRDYTIIVPLMISNLIAFFISQKLQPDPIYEALSHQDGIHLPTAQSRSQTGNIQVRQAMRPTPTVLSPDSQMSTVEPQVKGSSLNAWPVVGKDGLEGMIRNSEIVEQLRTEI